MKSFLIKAVVFITLLLASLNLTGHYLIQSNRMGHAVENSRLYTCLGKARTPWPETGTYIFGDSVANQMYPPETNSGRINSLTMMMPSTMAGHYFLLERLKESNTLKDRQVILILLPNSLETELEHKATFHYILKPFYNREFAPWNDPFFHGRIEKKAVAALSQAPMIRCSNWTPPSWIPYLAEPEANQPGISPLNLYYLKKMARLVNDAGGSFLCLPAIQRESRKGNDYHALREAIRSAGLQDAFDQYFESILYYPDELFRDSAHLFDRSILGNNVLNL